MEKTFDQIIVEAAKSNSIIRYREGIEAAFAIEPISTDIASLLHETYVHVDGAKLINARLLQSVSGNIAEITVRFTVPDELIETNDDTDDIDDDGDWYPGDDDYDEYDEEDEDASPNPTANAMNIREMINQDLKDHANAQGNSTESAEMAKDLSSIPSIGADLAKNTAAFAAIMGDREINEYLKETSESM